MASEERRISGREIMEETYRDTSVLNYLEACWWSPRLLALGFQPASTQADGMVNYTLTATNGFPRLRAPSRHAERYAE